MKILGMMAVAMIAVAPVAAQHTTVVHREVVVHHEQHARVGGHRHQVCTTRWDRRHHKIRHCTWQG